jgi:UDP-glucose 4-epimerase
LIPHCLAHLLGGESFVINGDGEQTRDFVYVGDIARANVLAIEGRVQGIFNCGTGRGVSVNEVCWALVEVIGKPMYFLPHGPAKEGEARHVALASSHAHRVLGWEAETTLADGLHRTIAWWKECQCVSV